MCDKTAVFIEKARAIHGDRYDYSRVDYKKAATKVVIICPIHGEFIKTPNKHLSGQGCPVRDCENRKQISTAEANKIATEKFIERSVLVHGVIYNYAKTKYARANQQVIITCPKHGDFKQQPTVHLRGCGCPVCGGERSADSRRVNTSSFVERAKEKHGDLYDYSLAHCEGVRDMVKIICKKHGEFYQQAISHIRGAGCKKCATELNRTSRSIGLERFIAKSSEAHGGIYDYSESEYINGRTNVKIKCRVHGYFYQRASLHAKGSGCPKCAGVGKLNTDEFIERAIEKHGDKYIYDKVSYKSGKDFVTIGCNVHGYFRQKARNHLIGNGCPDCGGSSPLDTKKFIARAVKIHGEKYDYSKVDYVNADTDVSITCRDHGEFKQTPYRHIQRKQGCPRCPRNYSNPCSVYIMTANGESKIGISSVLDERYRNINNRTEFDVTLHSFISCTDTPVARSIESRIHKQIAHLNCGYTGFDGATEWFNIDPKEAFDLVREAVESEVALATLIE